MKNIKPLVISNNSLSENSSNGRTLSGFLRNIPKQNIAQIYVTGEMPESEVCDNFYQITDRDVVGMLFGKKSTGRIISGKKNIRRGPARQNRKKVKKTVFTMMLRDAVWGTNIWQTETLRAWTNDFSPNVILFFAGESKFTYNMTIKIADEYNLPIVIYNCEAYYFNETNYIKKGVLSPILYSMFHHSFKKTFAEMMSRCAAAVYGNDKLKNDYSAKFRCNSYVLYTTSDVGFVKKELIAVPPVISYLGSLGLGRDKVLCEIADTLCDIDSSYRLDIYGRIPNDEVEKNLIDCQGINYCGVLPYDKVIEIMHKSDLLVHGECISDFIVNNFKYAFTTKIADSLSCGTPFLLYAPDGLACTEYLKQNNCACVVTRKEDLKDSLQRILFDQKLRSSYVDKAREIALKNHNTQKNCDEFERIIAEAAENYESNAN